MEAGHVLTMMTQMDPLAASHYAEVTYSGVHIQNTAEAMTRNCCFALKCASPDWNECSLTWLRHSWGLWSCISP